MKAAQARKGKAPEDVRVLFLPWLYFPPFSVPSSRLILPSLPLRTAAEA